MEVDNMNSQAAAAFAPAFSAGMQSPQPLVPNAFGIIVP
eukprot:CAMPEP_0170329008 /NCGR_PEP_ID=MMETSP0116_2-20130129/65418_1 /TAXON_ID=400756 /ORGANISM="Durinskia baltica, Strain CSIRO CS-38" /LENGTH=38 /DNA_ID= /DNA_START= /DNA_END= /DNA_ORIENTATION=